MGEHNFELDSGQLYFMEPDGSTSLVGHVTDATIECGVDLDDISTPIASLKTLEISFEMMAKEIKDLLLAITGMHRAYINCCPNRRVAHLAMHGKTARIRKKNFNRAIKILEEN